MCYSGGAWGKLHTANTRGKRVEHIKMRGLTPWTALLYCPSVRASLIRGCSPTPKQKKEVKEVRTTSNGGGVCTDRPRTVRRSIEREPLRGLWAIEQAQRAAAVRVTGRKAVRRKENPPLQGGSMLVRAAQTVRARAAERGGQEGAGGNLGGTTAPGVAPLAGSCRTR